jgi:hypothetical protein
MLIVLPMHPFIMFPLFSWFQTPQWTYADHHCLFWNVGFSKLWFACHLRSGGNVWLISCHYSLVNARIHETVFYSFWVSILVCKSLNGKTCQYSNNTFQERQKSFSFAKLNSQTCKGTHRPDAIRQRDANFQFSKTNKTVNG